MIWKIKFVIFGDPKWLDMSPSILVAAPTIIEAIKIAKKKYDSKYIVSIKKLGIL